MYIPTHAQFEDSAAVPERPVCDSRQAESLDEEDRKQDDTSDGIDWDEIIATTQEDFEAGRYAFNSADYPTHEAAMTALEQFMDSLMDEALREAAPLLSCDAPRP